MFKFMVNKKLFHCFIVLLLLGLFIFSVNTVFAQVCSDQAGYQCMDKNSGTDCVAGLCSGGADIQCCKSSGIVPDGGKKEKGDYTLNDFASIAINISNFILGLVGSLALLFFIYGGVMFLISSGSQERVTQAKQIIVGAVIGIVIVFTSYMIINFVAGALGIQGGILQSDWFSK